MERKTNGDWLRSMNNVELARFLPNICQYIKADMPIDMQPQCVSRECRNCIKRWLQQSAKGGEQDGAD